ncbi:MAG: hypothetical protein ACOCXG_03295 [Nanoarchaeota archaeon]
MELEEIHRAIVLNFQQWLFKLNTMKSLDEFYASFYQDLIALRGVLIREKQTNPEVFDHQSDVALDFIKIVVMDKDKKEIFSKIENLRKQFSINLSAMRELQTV